MRSWAIILSLGTLALASACSDKPMEEAVDAGEPDSGLVPDPCSDTMRCALTADMMFQEYIGTAGDEDFFTINIPSAGSVLQLGVFNDAQFSTIKLAVVLFDPLNNPVRNERYEGSGGGTERVDIQYTATSAGVYTVKVTDVGGDKYDRRNPYFVLYSIFSETDMNEPNNDAMHATLLTAGTGKSGTIGAQNDEDWFAIDIAVNKIAVINLTASGGDGSVRLFYQLYKPDGTTPIAQGFEPEGATTALHENRAVGNEAGRYLIKIFDDPEGGPNADLARIYVLTITFVDEPDVQDLAMPNETRGTATPMVSGQTYTGYIAAKSDLDYYVINVSGASMASPKLITVEANMPNTGPVDLAIDVLKPNGTDEVCADLSMCRAFRFVPEGPERPTKLATSHFVTADGRYLVLVKDNQDNDWDTTIPYTVKVDVLNDPDTNERFMDEGRSNAIVVNASTSSLAATIQFPWVEGYISFADDEDWYQFDFPDAMGAPATQNGDWLIELDIEKMGPTPVELQVFFLNAQGQYGGYGQSCRMPAPGDPDPTMLACQFPDADNAISGQFGEAHGDCLVVFREQTELGPHYFRITDLNRDDFDVRPGVGAYRFRVTLTAKCTAASVCHGQYVNPDLGGDLCERP